MRKGIASGSSGVGVTVISTLLPVAFPKIDHGVAIAGIWVGMGLILFGFIGWLRGGKSPDEGTAVDRTSTSNQALVAEMRSLAAKLRRAVTAQPDWQSDSDVTDRFEARLDDITARLEPLGIVPPDAAHRMTALQWSGWLEAVAAPLEREGLAAAKEISRAYRTTSD